MISLKVSLNSGWTLDENSNIFCMVLLWGLDSPFIREFMVFTEAGDCLLALSAYFLMEYSIEFPVDASNRAIKPGVRIDILGFSKSIGHKYCIER